MVEKGVCGEESVETREDGTVLLTLNCEACEFFPSIENEPRAMALVAQKILKIGPPTIVKLQQITEYEYDAEQTKMLNDLLAAVRRLQGLFSQVSRSLIEHEECKPFFLPRLGVLRRLLFETLLSDPLSGYVELIRMRQDEKQTLLSGTVLKMPRDECLDKYARFLEDAKSLLSTTALIQKTRPDAAQYQLGDRSLYARVFKATTKPDFMRSKIQSQYPLDAEILDAYTVTDPLLNSVISEVTIFLLPNSERKMYHVIPVEANLTWEKYTLLHEAKQVYEERPQEEIQKYTAAYLENPRGYLFKIAQGIVIEVASLKKMTLSEKEVDELSSILVRNMAGFGIIEIILTDKKVQDITVNSPSSHSPIYIKMRGFDECITNIYPTKREVESWATRLRFLSGRPLDEAHPILDTDALEITGNFRSRTAIITSPLNAVNGDFAFAIRQHAPDPVTFARYSQTEDHFKTIAKKNPRWAEHAWGAMMLPPSKRSADFKGLPFAAALLSFIIDGNRTLLVAGTRSSGKTTLLSSLILNISRRVRIITIEDTLEIPVNMLKEYGFNIQAMKVRSALSHGTSEVSAEDGIRTTLRLGDSSLIIGEVRSTEAKSLYEAMRVGALANVVAGTIHANDPYGVFDRVVNDLGVPTTSFKATDIIVMVRPLPFRGKRVTSITEVRKLWTTDPLRENGFVDLATFDYENDALEPTDALLSGDSDILKEIGSRIDAFAAKYDKILENIKLRAQVIQHLIDTAYEKNTPDLIRASIYVSAWDAFRNISSEAYEDSKRRKGVGDFPSNDILRRWKGWLESA